MPLFQQRHYEWLAAWARENLATGDRINLRNALARTNDRFDADRFDRASGAAEWLAGRAALIRSATPTLSPARSAKPSGASEAEAPPQENTNAH